ncbi:hypothetical protein HK096_002140 [Nowakowskiella sp. JEL0078]|nr:hypothetical protein HK096_002140 [Nowakowskiella sp. JEL0078]
MFSKLSIAFTVLAFISHVLARPDRSPNCDITTVKAALLGSPMAPNAQPLTNSYTFSADQTSYTPGQSITFTINGANNFNGILVYVSPTSDPTKRVGKFQIPSGFQNNADVCTNSEFPDSSITHMKGGNYAGQQTIVFEAPAQDEGELNLNVVLVVAISGGGYGWGIFPSAVKLPSGTGSTAVTTGAMYGITPMAVAAMSTEIICPKAFTATKVRKCKVKSGFQTTISATMTQRITTTTTTTCWWTETKTEKVTAKETITVTSCGAVLGDQETPTSTTSCESMAAETTAASYGY